jgi:hypothetical protein
MTAEKNDAGKSSKPDEKHRIERAPSAAQTSLAHQTEDASRVPIHAKPSDIENEPMPHAEKTTELLDTRNNPPRDLILDTLSTDDLKLELASSLQMTVENFKRIAIIVRILEERGEDLSTLRLSLLSFFRKIAHGQLSAHAVVRFAQFSQLLTRISNLPLPDQEKLANGGPVELVVRQGEAMTTRLLDPIDLKPEQLNQVFGKDRLRSQSEQIAIIESRQNSTKPVRPTGSIKIDRENNGLVIGRKFFPSDEILSALTELSQPVEESGEAGVINLDSSVVRLLRIQAAKRDTTIKALVVRACQASGLLRE